jgi:DNA-binding transcriptional LysR family regulator
MIAGLLPVALERLRRQYPRLSFYVTHVAAVSRQYHELRERNVDLIFGRMAKPIAEDVDATVLFHERTFVVAASHNPWARRRKIELSELVDQPWMLPPPESVVASLIADAFRAKGLDVPRATVFSSSFQLYGGLIAAGPYLAILPGSFLRFGAKHLSLKVLPVDLRIPPWPVAIGTLKKRTISPVAQLFIECAREVAKPLTASKPQTIID